jgi:hypothetical protein
MGLLVHIQQALAAGECGSPDLAFPAEVNQNGGLRIEAEAGREANPHKS